MSTGSSSAYLAEPTTEHVLSLARRLRSYWRPQDNLDEEIRALEIMDTPIYAARTSGTAAAGKRLQSGIWTQLVKRDAAIISFVPWIRFNPPDPEDAGARAHSSTLEAWTNAALARSAADSVLQERLARSLIGYGRAWTKTLWLPSVWADDEYTAAVERLEQAAAEGERTEAARELEALRRSRWPLTIRYVDPIGTYTYFDASCWLPEVIEVRRMTADAARTVYGSSPETEDFLNTARSGALIEVIEYANHEWQATVLSRQGARTGVLANAWRHGLHRSPYTLAETNITTTTVEGLRWVPTLFHAKEIIQAFDENLSDWRTNTHEHALGHIMQFFNPEFLSEDDKDAGRPKAQNLEAGGVSAWIAGEDVKQAPVPALTAEHENFRNFLYSLIQSNAIQPVLQGETKSGDSFTLLAGSHQIAERKFGPAMDAMLAAAEDRARSLLRCVLAINASPAGHPGKIYVYDRYQQKGALGIGPKDIIGWEAAIQARGQPALPMDRNREVAIAQGLTSLGVAQTLVLEELRFEDPEGVRRRSQREQLEAAIFQQVIVPYAVQRAQQTLRQATPEEQQRMQGLMGEASPGVAQAVQGLLAGGAPPGPEAAPPGGPPAGPPPGPEGSIPPELLQALSNVRRAGVPYAPREQVGALGQ